MLARRGSTFLAVLVATILFALPAFASPPEKHSSTSFDRILTSLDIGQMLSIAAVDHPARTFVVLGSDPSAIDTVKSDPKRAGKLAAKGGNALRLGDTIVAIERHYDLLL